MTDTHDQGSINATSVILEKLDQEIMNLNKFFLLNLVEPATPDGLNQTQFSEII